MVRPARPERSRSALPSRQLSRFCYLRNPDRVFGTHRDMIAGIPLAPTSDVVDMKQQIGGILIDAEGTRLLKLVETVTTALEANAQRPTARCGKHVPNAVAHHDSRLNRRAQSSCSREKKIRIGLGIFYLIARHDGNPIRIYAES